MGNNYVRLTLDRALTEDYQREPLVVASTGNLKLNDAVVRLTSNTSPPPSSDSFDSDNSLIVGAAESQWGHAFPAAYAEYVILPQSQMSMPRMVLSNQRATQQFIDKWFMSPAPQPLPSTDPDHLNWFTYAVPPNHQCFSPQILTR